MINWIMWGLLWEKMSVSVGKLIVMKLKELLKAKCPNCQTSGNLRRVIWGMPASEPDPNKFIVGGCCIPEVPYEDSCLNCDWKGSI